MMADDVVTGPPLLEIRGLDIAFTRIGQPDLLAVRGADLTIQPGEIHGLVGESGAGKSTLGSAILGLEAPGRITGGTMRLEGRELRTVGHAERREKHVMVRGRDVGAIFQDPLTALNPLFTIGAQLAETLRFHLDLDARAIRMRSIELLTAVGIPEPERRLGQYPHHFSGGMRQRVVIAMALACQPRLVVADEPTTALDVSVQAQILDLLRDLCKRQGTGVLLVTHNIGVIAQTTDRVTVMYRGQVVESGPTSQVLGVPSHAYTRSLIAAVPRLGRVLDRFPRINFIEGDSEIEASRRAPPAPRVAEPESVSEGPPIEVHELVVAFGGGGWLRRTEPFRAVDGVTFAVERGETFGLVGESGSGKSTIANALVGLLEPTSGTISFEGSDLASGGLARARRRMQMVFQDPFASLNARMRVHDIVAEPLLHHGLARNRTNAREQALTLLEDVGLERSAGARFPHAFSGGQRQRISIARAIASRPSVLVCDEPTSALDVSVQAQILNLLKDLKDAYGLTLVLISHDLPVIRQMCDRVAVMRAGRICELADADTLFETPRDPYTRELLDLIPRLDALDGAAPPTNPTPEPTWPTS